MPDLLLRKTPMTKADEMAWLDRAIAELGPDTYLGATFIDQRAAIEADLRSDIPPLQLGHLRAIKAEAEESLKATSAEARRVNDQVAAAQRHLATANAEEAAAYRRKNVHLKETVEAARDALQNLRALADL